MRERRDNEARKPGTRILVRQFRHQATPAQEEFWELVRDHRFDGHQFRRQHPVKSYIADFYCPALKLVIELDGEVHKTQLDRDRERDENLAAYSIRVVRIKNADLLANPQAILQQLRIAMQSLSGGQANIPDVETPE